jgi:hypothetical protein
MSKVFKNAAWWWSKYKSKYIAFTKQIQWKRNVNRLVYWIFVLTDDKTTSNAFKLKFLQLFQSVKNVTNNQIIS